MTVCSNLGTVINTTVVFQTGNSLVAAYGTAVPINYALASFTRFLDTRSNIPTSTLLFGTSNEITNISPPLNTQAVPFIHTKGAISKDWRRLSYRCAIVYLDPEFPGDTSCLPYAGTIRFAPIATLDSYKQRTSHAKLRNISQTP